MYLMIVLGLWLPACVLSRVLLFETPWIIVHQTPLSMGFSRQGYGIGLPFPPPGNLPHPGIQPVFPASPALQATLNSWITGEAQGYDWWPISPTTCLVFVIQWSLPPLLPQLVFKRHGNQHYSQIQLKAPFICHLNPLYYLYWKTFRLPAWSLETFGFAIPMTGTKLKFTSTSPLWKGLVYQECLGTIIKPITSLKNCQDFLSIQELHLCISFGLPKLSWLFIKASFPEELS